MRKIKHSKFRNTGILFELLVRQVTADILNGNNTSKANHIIRKYFTEEQELGKELKLYQLILQEKAKTLDQAKSLLELILKSRSKLSNSILSEQKFKLIQEISSIYSIEDFLRGNISNYKLLASVYKIFEEHTREIEFDPKDIYQSKNFILESILIDKKNSVLPQTEEDRILEIYNKQEEDVRLLTYKVLVDSFNQKYGDLDDEQKNILKEYIHNISNTNSLREYVNLKLPVVKKELLDLSEKIKDNVYKIKIRECVNQLDNIKRGKTVKEHQIISLLMSYELIKELKKVV